MRILWIPLTALCLVGCGPDRTVRTYADDHTGIDTAADKSGGNRSDGVAWTLPEGWTKGPDQGSGFIKRIATLHAGEGDQKVETSLIAFPDTGGIAQNIQRWAGQIGITLGPDELAAFVEGLADLENDAGKAGKFSDLTTLSKPGSPSILGGIITLDDGRTLYVKATGQHEALAARRDEFLRLCRSIR